MCVVALSVNGYAGQVVTHTHTQVHVYILVHSLTHTHIHCFSTLPAHPPQVLCFFFLCYISMAIVTYGLAVPSGLFVPSLLSGAAFGRMVASVLHTADGYHGTFADAGTYALVGAVAVLGGVARMTISLTVIMLEATGDMQYVLPLMVTLMMSRWSGNAICEGLYDIHIHLNKLPILENDPPETSRTHDLCAREIMSKEVVSVEPVMEVGALYDLVSSNTHSCYPVRA